MEQQFCTNCGAHLTDPGQRFCTSCGHPVEPAEAEVPVSTYSDTSGIDRMATDPGPAEAYAGQDPVGQQPTKQMPPVETAPAYGNGTPPQQLPAQPAYQAPIQTQYQAAPPRKPKSDTGLVIAIIAAALIILAAVLLAVLHPWDSGPAPEATASSSAQPSPLSGNASSGHSPSSSSSGSTSSSNSASSTTADEQLYDQLVAAYDKMAGFNARIAEAATTFNNTYTSSDSGIRRQNSTAAHNLKNEISGQLDSLKGLAVSPSSRYYHDYQNVLQLQQDLYNRIDVICQSWDNSLSYSNPKDHAEAILAPIARDNESDGVNRYKRDFDDLYPNARPVR